LKLIDSIFTDIYFNSIFSLIHFENICLTTHTVHEPPLEKSRRDYSYIYHLKKEDISIPVCKKIFLNTLCLNEWMVRNWINSSINGLSQSTKKIKKNNFQNNLNLEFDDEEEIEEPIPRVSVSVQHNHLISWFGS